MNTLKQRFSDWDLWCLSWTPEHPHLTPRERAVGFWRIVVRGHRVDHRTIIPPDRS
jgi:hypothetical protein